MDKSIILTTGVFDVLHHGHIKLFEWIWEKILTQNVTKNGWPSLVVGVNGDRRANEIKDTVIFTANERTFLIQACRYVNEVVIFDEDDPGELIRRVKPVIFVKGGDYASVNEEDVPELAVCKELGIKFVVGPLTTTDGKKYSSSSIKGSMDED